MMMTKIVILYLMALLDVLIKVWFAPNRLQALKELTKSERFVLVSAGFAVATLAFYLVKWAPAY